MLTCQLQLHYVLDVTYNYIHLVATSVAAPVCSNERPSLQCNEAGMQACTRWALLLMDTASHRGTPPIIHYKHLLNNGAHA